MELYGQYFDSGTIGHIHAIVAEEPTISRRKLSLRVCELLDWCAPSGRLKDADCRKAIMELVKQGRETPDVPCDVFFERDEWTVLGVWSTNELPIKRQPLRTAVRAVAELGGFLGRKGDKEPGTTTIWRGLVKLDPMAIGWAMAEARLRQRDGP